MNKQNKDLLLQLLIEQYQGEKNETPKVIIQRLPRPKKRNFGNHKWTDGEKKLLLDLDANGFPIADIAARLNLRRSQAENMLYSLKNKRGA